ncbi:MAG: NAD(+) synthase, partial [Pseudomonadota bacterium]
PAARGEADYDIAFENVQAGARTSLLFRLANKHNALVLGTGDLSEIALGWSTYGVGDQMSHYNVNGSVPKTLIQHLIRWVIKTEAFGSDAADAALAILNTDISPELIPGDASSNDVAQKTEEIIGPYALHDFSLYFAARYGLRPSKIAYLAHSAWGTLEQGTWPPNLSDHDKTAFDLATIKKWLLVFTKRFFETSQFKRSASPNGPKVVSGGSLSPRGDWRAPSDGSADIWLNDINDNVPEA